MQHDQQWLDDNVNICADDCKRYHEHMDRWRPLTELPEKAGLYIIYDELDGTFGKREYFGYPDGSFKWLMGAGSGTHWKPTGNLPKII